MNTDPISDMLTRIRNASASGKGEILLPFSKVKFAIAKTLEREGFIGSVKKIEQGKFPMLNVNILYIDDGPRIRQIRRVSKPGKRVYVKADALPNVLSGFGVAVVSTPSGIMTNKEAKKRCLGGEVICEVF